MKLYEIENIIDFIDSKTSEIEGIINWCEDYLEDKTEGMKVMKQLIEIKRVFQLGEKFAINSSKNKRKGNRYLSFSFLRDYHNKGDIIKRNREIHYMWFWYCRKSRTTLWRFKNDLKEIGINFDEVWPNVLKQYQEDLKLSLKLQAEGKLPKIEVLNK